MKYLVISYTPSRQGYLGPIPEKYEAKGFEMEDLDFFVNTLQVPPGGWIKVVKEDDVITIRAKTVNEVVE